MIPPQQSLLDLPISFFEYDRYRNAFGNVPSQQTTLRRITKTKYYRQEIEAIRSEPDKVKQDELKKCLPAFTPVALLNHRKRDTTFSEKVCQQHPLIMGDIDLKDNPGIDMAELKSYFYRLPYVLLCAYSVRGGLWFVVRLPEGQTPETLAAHFRYLQRLFKERFEIKLDSTKGGSPTDLRFVSYDPDPYINEETTEMVGTYTPPKPKLRQFDPSRFQHQDDSQLLTRIVRFAESAGEGDRHSHLLKAAKLIGGYAATGRIDEETGIYALETISSNWPNFTKSQKTIRDGVRYGLTVPIYNDSTPSQLYSEPRHTRTQPAKPIPSKWDNPIIEYIPVNVDEELSDYPSSWDTSAYQHPTVRVVPSPRRIEWANIFNLSEEAIPLFTLEPITP